MHSAASNPMQHICRELKTCVGLHAAFCIVHQYLCLKGLRAGAWHFFDFPFNRSEAYVASEWNMAKPKLLKDRTHLYFSRNFCSKLIRVEFAS